MRRTCVIVTLMMAFLSVGHVKAAWGDKMSKYCTLYDKQSFLRVSGNTLHFVNVDVEWPLWLGMNRQVPLQQVLCEMVFNRTKDSYEEALTAYLDSLGTPLAVLPPNDSLYTRCYHSFEVRIVDYSLGRYISFRTVALLRSATEIDVGETSHHIFTYDLKNKRRLLPTDLLAKACFYESFRNDYMCNTVARCTTDADWDIFEKATLPTSEMCILNKGLVFDLGVDLRNIPYHALTYVDEMQATPMMNKKVLKLLASQSVMEEEIISDSSVLPTTSEGIDTLKVYDVAEVQPEFLGGRKSLMNFLTQNLNYPRLDQLLRKEGKVAVQFVVERDGTVTSPKVIKPVSPGLDREAVRVVRMMPRWTSGSIDGVKVRTLYTLPFNFEITE